MTIQDNTWYWSEFFWTKQTLFAQLAKPEVCALDDNNKFMLKFSIWGPQCCCSLWGNCPCCYCCSVTHFSSVQSLSRFGLFATPWITARQASLHHQLPEFSQIHIHRVGDAIQPSHPLSSPSPPAPNPSQHQSLFQWANSSHEVAKVLEFQL